MRGLDDHGHAPLAIPHERRAVQHHPGARLGQDAGDRGLARLLPAERRAQGPLGDGGNGGG
jgi:hypothetical protein